MGGASSFYLMLAITGFLSAVWLSGRVARRIGISSILLEVGVGIILGPSVLKLIPGELSECADARITNCDSLDDQRRIANSGPEYCDLQAYLDKNKYVQEPLQLHEGFFGNVSSVELGGQVYPLTKSNRRLASGNKGKTDYKDYAICLKEQCGFELAVNCATHPDVFTMVGHTGVAMMIFESGMHFDFVQAKTVGPLACAVAVLGTFLPIFAGTALSYAYGYPVFPDGLSVGVSLAPTSIGIALKLLHEAHSLNTFFGQAVMTAAFVDDVLSLILFSILFALRGTMTFLTFLPLICGCIFMALAVVAAVKVWPPLIDWIFSKIPEDKAGANMTRHDEVMWLLMFVVLVAYALITHLCGTHLWGCFIAGMSFAMKDNAHHVWVRQVKKLTCWFLRIFFAATLAWAIPIGSLFTLDSFWKGSIMGIGPCILMKVLCAPFMGKAKWVIGWAMVGRAEFAYFIAIMAKSLKMMDDDLFAIIIWALVYATIFAPLIFRWVLKKFVEAKHAEESKAGDANLPTGVIATLERQISDASSAGNSASGIKHQSDFGHVPDLYGEKLEQDKKAKLAAAESVLEELATAELEIARLRKLLVDAEAADSKQQESQVAVDVAATTGAGSDAEAADSKQQDSHVVVEVAANTTAGSDSEAADSKQQESHVVVDVAATATAGSDAEAADSKQQESHVVVDVAATTTAGSDAKAADSKQQKSHIVVL